MRNCEKAPRYYASTPGNAGQLITRKQVRICIRESWREPYLLESLDHLHKKLREDLQLPEDFVIHSLRHTFLARFGEAVADAFTIKKVAEYSSVSTSERYTHPTPEGRKRAFERFANLNQMAVEK